MTSAHFIYIPVVVLVGIMIGFFLGGRAARDAMAMEAKKAEALAEAKAKRAAAREARAQKGGGKEKAGTAPIDDGEGGA